MLASNLRRAMRLAMNDVGYDLKLKTIGLHPNGSRAYDRAGKEALVLECLKPGVSLARIAVANDLNPNLVRKWVVAHRKEMGHKRNDGALAPVGLGGSAFIEIVGTSGPLHSVDMAPPLARAATAEVDVMAGHQAVGGHTGPVYQAARPRRGKGGRPDPLNGIFPDEVVPLLEANPNLRPVAILEKVLGRHPGLDRRLRRTLERRIREWQLNFGTRNIAAQARDLEPADLPDLVGVSETGIAAQTGARTQLDVSLPNGVTLSLKGMDAKMMAAAIEALSNVPSGR